MKNGMGKIKDLPGWAGPFGLTSNASDRALMYSLAYASDRA